MGDSLHHSASCIRRRDSAEFKRSNLQEPWPLSTLGKVALVLGLPHRLPSTEHGQEAAAALPGVTASKGRVEGAGDQSC